MKAIEYFNVYYPRLVTSNSETNAPIIVELIKDLYIEMVKIMKDRHISKPSSMRALEKEFHQKWKCIIKIFKENGHGYFKEDWF